MISSMVQSCGRYGAGERRRQQLVGDLKSQRPVAFELRLAEELIARALVREIRIGGGIASNADVLDAVIGGLDVQQEAVFPAAVRIRVVDRSDRVIRRVGPLLAGRPRRQLFHVLERDPHAKIEGDLADGVAEIVELELRIATGIAHDDQAAAPPHHLVDAEVLEVTAVGQIDVLVRVGRQSEHLGQKRPDRNSWTVVLIRFLALLSRIAQPPAQPDVEQRHQEGDRRRRVIAHVRTSRGARDSHRGAERNALVLVPILPA